MTLYYTWIYTFKILLKNGLTMRFLDLVNLHSDSDLTTY